LEKKSLITEDVLPQNSEISINQRNVSESNIRIGFRRRGWDSAFCQTG